MADSRYGVASLALLCACAFDPVAGAPEADAGPKVERDGGMVTRDGGLPPRDGGVEDRDAGTPRDAGLPRDGGMDPRDAGLIDGGVRDGGPVDLPCGNGRVMAPEECDDRNNDTGDGCDPQCFVESGWVCFGEPSLCRMEASIVYVDVNDMNCPGAGTLNDPYCDLSDGIADRTPVVVVRPGMYVEDQAIEDQTVEIIGDGVVSLRATGSKLFVISGVSDVTFRRVILLGTNNDVIDLGGASIARVIDSQVGPGQDHGIHVKSEARLELDRTVVKNLDSTALILGGSGGFSIQNSMVVANGAVGIEIATSEPTSVIVNVTIVDNDEGIDCGSGFDLVNVLLFRNTTGASANCNPSYSMVQGTATGTNITGDPLFGSNYRLTANSSCIDVGDPAGVPPAPEIDIDFNPRPRGGRVDIGAHEF